MGGKTGTSEDENDAWFIGFTNDVTVGVWVGYDNSDGKRRTLGGGQTGGRVAVPIFEPIIEATWANYAPQDPARPALARGQEGTRGAADRSCQRQPVGERRPQGFTEYFRLRNGQLEDTQYTLVSAG